MRLYLIKRRSDRKFFGTINGHYILHSGQDGEYWSDKPQTFLKTPEGVAGNLRRLCSEPFWDTEPPKGISSALRNGWKELAWRNFDGRKLKKYEIVAMDVDVLAMSAMPASEFIQIEAIRSRPLSRKERAA